jgi:hypothetical protein
MGADVQIGVEDFITRVKKELMAAECKTEAEPLLYLDGVQLEIAFQVELQAGGGFKLFVVDAKTDVKASATHKVTINLKPLTVQQRNAIHNVKRPPDGGGPYARIKSNSVVVEKLLEDIGGAVYVSGTPRVISDLPVFLKEGRVGDDVDQEEGLVHGE